MRYIYSTILSIACCACSMTPSHIGISPGCEWEMIGGYVVHKPSIKTSFDWNM